MLNPPKVISLSDDFMLRHRPPRHGLGGLLVTWANAGIGAVRRVHAEHRARAQERAMAAELARLSDATLRDLGMHRCEIHSACAEATGRAEPTRLGVLRDQGAPGHPAGVAG